MTEGGIENKFEEAPFGVNQTKRLTVQAAENILYHPAKCLDHGFVRLVDYMGGDDAVVQAARVSYGKGTRKISEDTGIIRYLMRHQHTTPFEMVEIKFHAKMPIFVARQWVRHRTASINEYSGRYSILDNEFYVPEPKDLAAQSTKNKQGREQLVPIEEAAKVIALLKEEGVRAYDNYEFLLNEDPNKPGSPADEGRSMLARELARMKLSLDFYTQWYWKIDLHNLFRFLGLRKDKHAQYEIRVYADAMGEMTRAVAPISYESFEDYNFNALHLSALDVEVIRRIQMGEDRDEAISKIFGNKRERDEFLEKLKRFE